MGEIQLAKLLILSVLFYALMKVFLFYKEIFFRTTFWQSIASSNSPSGVEGKAPFIRQTVCSMPCVELLFLKCLLYLKIQQKNYHEPYKIILEFVTFVPSIIRRYISFQMLIKTAEKTMKFLCNLFASNLKTSTYYREYFQGYFCVLFSNLKTVL